MEHFDPASAEANDVGGYCGLFSAFCLGLIRDFQDYADGDDADLRRDVTGFASLGLYLTDEQARDLVRRMAGLMRGYTERTSDDQRLHTMACVLSPPRDGGRTAERSAGSAPVARELEG